MTKLRIGVMGASNFSQFAHIANYAKLEGVQVTALADADDALLRRVANQYQIAKVFSDFQDLVKEELDAVSICLPNSYHAAAAVAALQSGKHVLCEKPLAVNAAEAQTIVDAARSAEKILMVGFQGRFTAEALALRRLVDRGRLGEVYFAQASHERRRGIPVAKDWCTQKALAGGGALIDIGVHAIDLAMWMMNFPKPVSAMGMIHQKFRPARAENTYDVEDFASGYVRFENGASLIVRASWASHIAQNRSVFELLGTRGGATMDPLTIYTQDDGQLLDVTPVVRHTEDPHLVEVRHFVDCIRNNRKPIITGEQALVVTRVTDAIYKSAAEGGAVAV